MANEKGCLYPTAATYNWKKVFTECEETATNQKQKNNNMEPILKGLLTGNAFNLCHRVSLTMALKLRYIGSI